MVPYQRPHRNRVESGLVVNLVLWDISLQKRQVCVCGRSGSDVVGVSSNGGVETGTVTSYLAGSGARPAGRAGDWGGAEAGNTFMEPTWSSVAYEEVWVGNEL